MRPLFGFAFGLLTASFSVATQSSWVTVASTIIVVVLIGLFIQPAGTFSRISNALATAIGCMLVILHPLANKPSVEAFPRELIGDVCSPVRSGPTSARFTLCTPTGKYVIKTQSNVSLSYLDRVRVTSEFLLPEPPRNIGEFDYQQWCRFHHIRAVSSANATIHVENNQNNILGAFITTFRSWIAERCKSGLPAETAPLASGILLSITDDLPFELQEAFGRTGTVHVLSTSGMHISVLVASIGTICVWAGRFMTVSTGIGLSIIVGYASGGGPAPIRSVTSLFSRLAARAVMRPAEPWHVLCLCASVAVLRDPFVVMDAGAQLSFLAVAGLIVATPFADLLTQKIRESPAVLTKISMTLLQGILISLIVTLVTAPTVAYHMQHLSLVSPIANLPVGFLSEWALLIGMVSVVLGDMPIVGELLWSLTHGLLHCLILVTHTLAENSWSDVATGVSSPWSVVSSSSVILGLVVFVGRRLTIKSSDNEPKYYIPWSTTKSII